jgi:hypothetical protein
MLEPRSDEVEQCSQKENFDPSTTLKGNGLIRVPHS